MAGPSVDGLVGATVSRVVRSAVRDGAAGADGPTKTAHEVRVAVPVDGEGAVVLAVFEVGNLAVVVLDVVWSLALHEMLDSLPVRFSRAMGDGASSASASATGAAEATIADKARNKVAIFIVDDDVF